MTSLHPDPRIAERQMRAIIYYLTAFGFIDGDFDVSEKLFIRKYVKDLIASHVMGDEATQWIDRFYAVIDQVDEEIRTDFGESVGAGEETRDYVFARLKLRCFELFCRFDEAERASLLRTADELMSADGVIHPGEQQFRDELAMLLAAPVELEDSEIESVPTPRIVITAPASVLPREVDHPFLQRVEEPYASDPVAFWRQAKADLELVHRVREKLADQRRQGSGRLAGKSDLVVAGESTFLDGYIYVVPTWPGEEVEMLVIGDLHGCYSCLKAALMQGDFFGKVGAYYADPVGNPRPLLVLLGDYIDRGRYSYDGVLRAVMEVFLAAPDHVFVLRGNHEFYLEHRGKVVAPVRPAEAMASLASIAPPAFFAEYMNLFDELPSALIFDRLLFVHAGIPRDDTLATRFTSAASLNDPLLRFQMLWSEPSEADVVPLELQKASTRFSFGKRQFKAFMSKLGLTTLIRGHDRVREGFCKVYDDVDGMLLTLFSAGGCENGDLPETSNYREVTPMALRIRYRDGESQMTPFPLDYARYNLPENNAFFRGRAVSGGGSGGEG